MSKANGLRIVARLGKKTLIFIGLFFLFGISLLFFSLWMAKHMGAVNHAGLFIKEHFWGVAVFRVSIMLVITWLYPKLVKLYANKKGDWTEGQVIKYARRRYIVIFFFGYELLIVHQYLSVFFNWVIGY